MAGPAARSLGFNRGVRAIEDDLRLLAAADEIPTAEAIAAARQARDISWSRARAKALSCFADPWSPLVVIPFLLGLLQQSVITVARIIAGMIVGLRSQWSLIC